MSLFEAPPLAEAPPAAPPPPEVIRPYERVRLGGDEYAICGVLSLVPDTQEEGGRVNIAVLDVGFREADGKYGPYDIDGSGTKQTFNKPYLLVRRELTDDGPKTHVFEFGVNEPVVIGRHRRNATSEALGLENNTLISRDHAQITASEYGVITVQDLGSKNGTKTRPVSDFVRTPTTDFTYTFKVDDYVSAVGKGHHLVPKEEQLGWGHGLYSGRPKIARDTPINTGVYLVGGSHGEALVIDDKRYPNELNEVYAEVLDTLSNTSQGFAIQSLRDFIDRRKNPTRDHLTQSKLETVLGIVGDKLRYNLQATDAIANDYQKVTINTYIREGVGVCRTQAALSAYIIERLIKDGHMEGSVSIDRNLKHEGVPGGHAWARYRSPDGQVYIIDPAQRYVGRIEDTYGDNNKWDYRRSEDVMKVLLAA